MPTYQDMRKRTIFDAFGQDKNIDIISNKVYISPILIICIEGILNMTFVEGQLKSSMNTLHISDQELADFLSVTLRTVNRWHEDASKIPGSVEQVIHAWLKLHHYKLAWRPDEIAFAEYDENVINEMARLRRKACDVDNVIAKIKKQGGPKLPWRVDLERGVARLETLEVRFYVFDNTEFTPASYVWKDNTIPDLTRHQDLINEAYTCIDMKISDQG